MAFCKIPSMHNCAGIALFIQMHGGLHESAMHPSSSTIPTK